MKETTRESIENITDAYNLDCDTDMLVQELTDNTQRIIDLAVKETEKELVEGIKEKFTVPVEFDHLVHNKNGNPVSLDNIIKLLKG